MITESKMDDPSVRFPSQIQVLAVHNNPTCLALLKTLLRKCGYYVTTASSIAVAINLLREKSGKFDLVISDVNVHDFQLLELVGLEMDLPIVLLSADDDPNIVLKGINHEACWYLLKPVRHEEIKNLWQHMYRRKKLDHDGPTKKKSPSGCIAKESNETVLKKRKDENGKAEDNMQQQDEDGPPAAKKMKARLTWSPELHRKFIEAVNYLGIEKAVPKKILELMDNENVTREQVASHLQKYRLSLKRDSKMANEQAGAALFGFPSPIASYAQKVLLNGSDNGNLYPSFGLAPFPALRPFPTNPILTPSNDNTTIKQSHGVDVSTNFSVPTNLSVPFYGPCDLGTSTRGGSCSMPCISRNQSWPCDSPIRGVCNEFMPSSSSKEDCSSLGLPFDFHIDSIYEILRESLSFTEQPSAREDLLVLPAMDSRIHGSENESNIEKTEEEEEEEWMSRRRC